MITKVCKKKRLFLRMGQSISLLIDCEMLNANLAIKIFRHVRVEKKLRFGLCNLSASIDEMSTIFRQIKCNNFFKLTYFMKKCAIELTSNAV